MSRKVDQKLYVNYLTKAEQSLHTAELALSVDAFDAAVGNAIHSAINTLDSLTVYSIGKRAADDHSNVLSLVKPILGKDYNDIEKQFGALIELKNSVEYQPYFASAKNARLSISRARRILEKVKTKLPS
jgi:uncharacterized protein (UPF0332 family)